jgi:hypothetical protein
MMMMISGKKTMMMAPLEFYSAITPDCQLVHGVGSGVYVEVTEEEVQSGKVSISVNSSTGSAPGSTWRLQRRRFSLARVV